MVLTKHASKDPRGDNPNPKEPEAVFNSRWFKTVDFQKKWDMNFKTRQIIVGRDFEKTFPGKYTTQMLTPMNALGWTNFRPIPKLAYTKLVRSFFCNLEVGNLDNLEYTIDSRVRGKNIVLTPTILSEITGITNEGELVFISKPSHLDKYVSKTQLYEVIAIEGVARVTDTKHLKPEFRLFHRYIAHNIIPKAGHYGQVTNMDAFIIYKAAMEEPLNLNYIILKEMADVRNHNTRSLPFGAFLTRIFLHFGISLDNQPSQGLPQGFSKNTVKKGKSLGFDEGEGEDKGGNEGNNDMEIDLTIVPFEGIPEDPHVQEQEQGERSDDEHDGIHEGIRVDTEFTSHEKHPTQGETSTQEGPPAWFFKYFGELKDSLGRIEQHQEEIIQTQIKHGEYIDRLGDFYENLNAQQQTFHQQFSNQLDEVEAQVDGLWVHLVPPPRPPPCFPLPRRPPYRQPPY
ncbi:uncharacterized protein LOC130774654 [Actinidia eriantha]|uniref:uncharacterized protein LOC130774654 n=1 Tax=Actinidia eriantha TaxID=165200 RepID=UPI002588AC59|nr:uncharacterized protein LOC130774654 [Actinidia eriantha]